MISFRDTFNKNVISKFKEIKIENLFFLKKANIIAVTAIKTYSPPKVVINRKNAVTGMQIIDEIWLYTNASKEYIIFNFNNISKAKKIIKAIEKHIAFFECMKLCIKSPLNLF